MRRYVTATMLGMLLFLSCSEKEEIQEVSLFENDWKNRIFATLLE
jgi:hypothetical protein